MEGCVSLRVYPKTADGEEEEGSGGDGRGTMLLLLLPSTLKKKREKDDMNSEEEKRDVVALSLLLRYSLSQLLKSQLSLFWSSLSQPVSGSESHAESHNVFTLRQWRVPAVSAIYAASRNHINWDSSRNCSKQGERFEDMGA
ncbi:hypothetical protein PIB30_034634 [Stylosanthes scabra]|uniref:Uncharacterized protein n=1 Tax=Stylosanthes scabra TaxID=79078 RepID=A0ABU6YA41_9FABA|nr:hypothetical protein [Stylosanthes scabra]